MDEINQSTKYREVTLEKWGNNMAIILTKDILEDAGFTDAKDMSLEIRVEENKITLTRKNKLTPFQRIFEGYDGDRPDAEVTWDETEPVGNEKL